MKSTAKHETVQGYRTPHRKIHSPVFAMYTQHEHSYFQQTAKKKNENKSKCTKRSIRQQREKINNYKNCRTNEPQVQSIKQVRQTCITVNANKNFGKLSSARIMDVTKAFSGPNCKAIVPCQNGLNRIVYAENR